MTVENSGRTTISAHDIEDVRRGFMLVLAAPSGAGKGTIANRLLADDAKLALSVSATTRAPRATEEHGVHYQFLESDEFERKIKANELLEWAKVHDNYYGTPREPVDASLSAGKDILFDIDIVGVRQLQRQAREDVVAIFVLPPSIAEMQARLEGRGDDNEAAIKRRMQTAIDEVSGWQDFDYIVVNDDLDNAVKTVQSIIASERLKRIRLPKLAQKMDGMIADLEASIAK
ncbi:Guanylate kinase [Pseudovibrio axinellae]|uniref:Guanylate kinase n=1 Tax=Pseudovibrio axinellae TaxID=989403 RepID=A0A165UL62_9HYPH|nr:guanylate kinase [Pseudovibrio axinellae]KZL12497.1 Guanylate kinase [Pseudovibrio axinellae]SEP69672.1 guanylate kinase [Pseudovibrio axinellae]